LHIIMYMKFRYVLKECFKLYRVFGDDLTSSSPNIFVLI